MSLDALAQTYCPVCERAQPFQVAEQFNDGAFVECAVCGVHFAETRRTDLQTYYREIWGDGNLGCDPYTTKVVAARDPVRLEELLSTVPRFRWAVRQLRRLNRGARILDVGCGEGALLWAARQMGFEPHGCDLAEPAVELARGLVGASNVHVGTISDLSYAPKTFDALLALEVLEHLPSPRAFLERTSTLLQPAGTLLLTMPNRHRVFAVLKRALGKPHSSTDYPPHHLTRWSARALRNLLRQFFRHVRVGSLPYYFAHPAGRALARPLHLLSAARMGQSLCATARMPVAASRSAIS
jgi:2-polyprenyl-3-methyl-5-hydroxy-6-metoxy-1,4-benzoquinol methylase